MPKAKKDKLVSLTKVKPKNRQHKEYIVEKVHLFMKKFSNVYVLNYENMTTNNFKVFKDAVPDSKFLMGKNKVLAVAFGTDEENSHMPNSYRIGQLLKGHCALFFTNMPNKEVKQLLEHEQSEYATGGTIADRTIILYKGFDALKQFSHSMQPHFRQLGLPTRLVNSKIQLLSDFLLAQQSKPLSVERCKILKHLDIKMSRLKFTIKAHYDGKTFKQYEQ